MGMLREVRRGDRGGLDAWSLPKTPGHVEAANNARLSTAVAVSAAEVLLAGRWPRFYELRAVQATDHPQDWQTPVKI